MTCGSVLTDAVANLAVAAKGSYNEKKPSVVTFRGQLPAILYPENGGRSAMKQILIVEDDGFLNEMLTFNLAADGYGITPALNAGEAAAAYST